MSAKGFTLLEMAMVLIMIALIAAGLLVGQEMMRQSAVNSIMADKQNYVTATGIFKTKYGALPGDYAMATDVWGVAGGNSGDNYSMSCGGTQGTGTQTCNGNGNGTVYTGTASYRYEMFRYWQQLVNEGLIEGTYTGVSGTGSSSSPWHIVGQNCPLTKVDNIGMGIQYIGTLTSNISYFDGEYNHFYIVGTQNTASWPLSGGLSGKEAQQFDTKFDDGMPALGMVRTGKPSLVANCANGSTSAAVYSIAASGKPCVMLLLTGF